ncbi:alpha-N-acetylglucosaminidase [Leguminivora glycinivorella]|uniref:alpha-N-acetylglucosaminidase n=1 Tax=Leguminivora glycinivorella TaxID=1035111 RepID=UPI00200F1DAA|nr:alpha-N-acetylglucosaminidase [Leguminivora glycinivorella]
MKPPLILLLANLILTSALNLDYLDPTKLQTKTAASIQQDAASNIISQYMSGVIVEVNPILFSDKKDVFSLWTSQGVLHIRASTGVAAVWGFNYYLKKYCKSHIGWQNQRISIPSPLPEVTEVVIANDRFRYYQNVCTASYSFVWWSAPDWKQHVEWMALNGINLALAPVAQEAAWTRIYRSLGLTDEEINDHFTGPAFLAWNRMGNVRGWAGPLTKSWHDIQRDIQSNVLDYMFQLGIIPVLPAFNGHVPKALSRIFPNVTTHAVETWNKFDSDYCCGSFLDPNEPLFKDLGKQFITAVTLGSGTNHIYTADPFNEVKIQSWSTSLVKKTAQAIYTTLKESDNNAVWLVQNWMFVHDPILWPMDRVKAFLTAVPSGRMLVLDLQSEQWPQYDLYEQYFGQPFVWCMLHNFGGTLGMFGNMKTINADVYTARSKTNSTMIGVGLTPEGINQNYVVYELMLESAWRREPVDLNTWIAAYAERRYGCNETASAWHYLLKSVYSFDGLNKIRGKYVVTRRPSFRIKPWAWYKSHDLFQAFKKFVEVCNSACYSPGYYHDLVDITRQALQYRAEQLYVNLQSDRFSNTWVFNGSISLFLDAMQDMERILSGNSDFTLNNWLSKARGFAEGPEQTLQYDLNARNQITLWGPNGEITDYACKQWAEMFHYYYIPRWRAFLDAALMSKVRGEFFDEASTQRLVRATVEERFLYVEIDSLPSVDVKSLALALYQKWAFVPGVKDLPLSVLKPDPGTRTTLADVTDDELPYTSEQPTVVMLATTPV